MKNEKFDKKIKEMQDNLQIKGKIYFYIRVSSNDQLEDGQFLKAKEFCEKNNIDINDCSPRWKRRGAGASCCGRSSTWKRG